MADAGSCLVGRLKVDFITNFAAIAAARIDRHVGMGCGEGFEEGLERRWAGAAKCFEYLSGS